MYLSFFYSSKSMTQKLFVDVPFCDVRVDVLRSDMYAPLIVVFTEYFDCPTYLELFPNSRWTMGVALGKKLPWNKFYSRYLDCLANWIDEEEKNDKATKTTL